MKILVICQNYYPERFRITDICEELVKMGNDVYVITGFPNYPKGKIFKGYRFGKNREQIVNGVKIHRCFTVPRGRCKIFRVLNYYSFKHSSVRYVKKLKENFDVVFVNQLSPVMMASAGVEYKKKFGTKLVLYCLDLWPESLLAGGVKRDSFVYDKYRKISEKIYKSCDKILVSSSGFSEYFKSEFGINDTEYLPQYAEDVFFDGCFKKTSDGKINITFAGNVGVMQNVDAIIGAAKITENKGNIVWNIVGDGSELSRLKEKAKGLTNVVFHGAHPIEEMPKFYAKSDAMLVSLKNGSNMSYTLPGKVQTYMAAGKPIIAMTGGETERVIKEANCGYCVKCGDEQELAEIAMEIANGKDMTKFGNNALNYYREHFSKETFFAQLKEYLK